MNETRAAIARGVAAGLFAGIPRVLIAPATEKPLDLPSEKADIGPGFVRWVAEHLNEPLPTAALWFNLTTALAHAWLPRLGAFPPAGRRRRRRRRPAQAAAPAAAGGRGGW